MKSSLKSCAYKPDDILIILIPSSSKKHLDEKICRIFTTATKDDKFLARKDDKSANVPPLIERYHIPSS